MVALQSLLSRASHRAGALLLPVAVAVALVATLVASGAPAATGATTTTTSSTTTTTTPSTPHNVPAYWLVASDGGIFSFGGMPFYGSMGGKPLAKPMVGMAPTTDYKGYWTVASDGGIFSFGDAPFRGSVPGAIGHAPSHPVVSMAVDPATGGYWLVGTDGGLFSFGAPFFGSVPQYASVDNVVAMAATPDGGGYWLFASDGGVFSFGDAKFYGSIPQAIGHGPSQPVVGASATTDGKGYWLVASDGGIFSFGDATFFGSMGGQPLVHPMAAMATADAGGYWMTDDNGAVTAFGDAGYFGSAPQQLGAPIVGMADGPGNGSFAGSPYQTGAYGYDVSSYQCGQMPTGGHAIGIVKAYQWNYPNNCLGQEAQWAGAGLNLYIYMVGGTQALGEPSCTGTYATSCNFGYAQAVAAFDYAKSVSGVNPMVAWWLDVESDPSWSSDTAANAAVVAGAITGLRDEGINNVGVYTNLSGWNPIVGNYQPAVALWIAWWTGNGPSNCQNIAAYEQAHNEQLPTGPVFLTQYTDQANGQSLDGDYAC